MREWYSLKDDLTVHTSKRNTMEKGIQYLRELSVMEGWKQSPTTCHGLIQTALEKGEAPEHLQYIDDITVWGNIAEEVFEKGEDNPDHPEGLHRKWKAAIWSPTWPVAEAIEGQDESNQVVELKTIQLALDVPEQEKWPGLYLYTDLWMVANALWAWLDQWKKTNWQCRGKPIWAAELWQDIVVWVEKLAVKVPLVHAHLPKSQGTEEHRNKGHVDQVAKIQVSQVDLEWQHKGELFLVQWAHDAEGHQGRGDATYRLAHDLWVDLTMDTISQVIHEYKTCTAINQAKWVKPLWCGG
ncbi:hypothetical protein BTVI_06509 [Pitangus sulphuratus]|nr:hypothetical protein BTVI_06509 [Pitangus sulphuratus]